MLRRVSAYPSGLIIYEYHNRVEVSPRDGEATVVHKVFNKKEQYESLDRADNIRSHCTKFSVDELYNDISPLDTFI